MPTFIKKLMMLRFPFVLVLAPLLWMCAADDADPTPAVSVPPTQEPNLMVGCPDTPYQNWETSPYVLPYPVGKTYQVHLSHCSGSYHSDGRPDKFAVDFAMPIGSIITASRAGEVVHIVENGFDGEFPNNLVVVKQEDSTFAQYMHLTRNGADVAVGDNVVQGDTIGRSGATGLAGYPHLHFVVTVNSWAYPYTSTHYNFKNTVPNPRGPVSRREYTAFRYE